jgi:phage-related protein
VKKITWLGNTHETVKGYSILVKQDIGYNLDKVQRGIDPCDWKPMTSIGQGVKEIRIHEENEYRVIYVAKFEESIYVLHAFVKKTEQTSKKDLGLAKQRYIDMLKMRRLEK